MKKDLQLGKWRIWPGSTECGHYKTTGSKWIRWGSLSQQDAETESEQENGEKEDRER